MSIELRQAAQQALKALEAISDEMTTGERYTNAGQYLLDALGPLRAALSQQPAKGEPMLSTDIAPRPLSYSLDDYHRAPSEGALHYTWQDKPHRLLYDLIAAVAYYAGKQPATPEPVLFIHPDDFAMNNAHVGAWKPGYELTGYTPLYTHPAPSVPKDHQIAALVNKVRDISRMFHDHQSLRERIAIELVPALKASQEVKSNAERAPMTYEQRRLAFLASRAGHGHTAFMLGISASEAHHGITAQDKKETP